MEKLSTLSYWERSLFPLECDLCIIGGGFTGSWATFHLSKLKPGLKVILLESQSNGRGASTRNAGFLCYGSPSEILQDVEKMGEDRAAQLVGQRHRGLQMIKKFIPAKDVEMKMSDGFEFFPHKLEELRQHTLAKVDDLNNLLSPHLGFTPFYFQKAPATSSPKNQLHNHRADRIISIRGEGQVNPAKLLQYLNLWNRSTGAELIEGVEVTKLQEGAHSVRVETNLDLNIDAKKVLVATNGFYNRLFPNSNLLKPARNVIALLQSDRPLGITGNFHCDRGYIYFRAVENKLLIGGGRNWAGEGEYTESMKVNKDIEKRLIQFAEEQIFTHPIHFEKILSWAGIMGVGDEKQPVMKWESDRVYSAVRLSGMGVALSPLMGYRAAREIVDKL
nr:FAD-binding oxidoreductase [Saprospiraceae bacterium]